MQNHIIQAPVIKAPVGGEDQAAGPLYLCRPTHIAAETRMCVYSGMTSSIGVISVKTD